MVFFLSGGRKEGPHGAFQLETAAGILLRSSVDAEGAHGVNFSEQGLAGYSYQTAAQRSWPSGLSPPSRKMSPLGATEKICWAPSPS